MLRLDAEKTKGNFQSQNFFTVQDMRKPKRHSREPQRENCLAPVKVPSPKKHVIPFYMK